MQYNLSELLFENVTLRWQPCRWVTAHGLRYRADDSQSRTYLRWNAAILTSLALYTYFFISVTSNCPVSPIIKYAISLGNVRLFIQLLRDVGTKLLFFVYFYLLYVLKNIAYYFF